MKFRLTNLFLALLCVANFSFAQSGGSYMKVSHQFAGNPTTAELLSLAEQRLPLLSRSAASLELQRVFRSPGGVHHSFKQTLNGIPITDRILQINMTRGYRVMNFGRYILEEDLPIVGDFLVDPLSVEAEVRSNYHLDQPDFRLNISQEYFPEEDFLRPVYRAETYGTGISENYELFYDATDLTLVLERNLTTYHHRSSGDTDCIAKVFNPDPLTSAHVQYGFPYINGSTVKTGECDPDEDSPWLNGMRVTRTLRDISNTNGVMRLQGPYVTIIDSLEPPYYNNPVSINDCAFEYKRGEQEFEAVNAYYHIDTFQRYIQTLGFDSLFNYPIQVDPHGLYCNDNSKFVPNGGSAWLGFGEGCVDDAEDADVVIHEYGHALSYAALPGANIGTERQGLDEGIGDYFAASYSMAIDTFRWADLFTWDGHNDCWPGREGASSITYPQTNVFDIYQVGELWVSALMVVHQQIGRTPADRIQLEALSMNIQSTKIPDAAQYILDADSMLYGGQYQVQYIAEFCDRQILNGGICAVSSEANIPAVKFNWQVYPNPSNGMVYIRQENERAADRIEIHDMHGRMVEMLEGNSIQYEFDLSKQPDGIFLVSAYQDGLRLASKRVSIVR